MACLKIIEIYIFCQSSVFFRMQHIWVRVQNLYLIFSLEATTDKQSHIVTDRCSLRPAVFDFMNLVHRHLPGWRVRPSQSLCVQRTRVQRKLADPNPILQSSQCSSSGRQRETWTATGSGRQKMWLTLSVLFQGNHEHTYCKTVCDICTVYSHTDGKERDS
jgi:hypothetical protein